MTDYYSKTAFEELQKAQNYLEEYLETNCEYLARQEWECAILKNGVGHYSYLGYSFKTTVEHITVELMRRKYPRRSGDPDVWDWNVKGIMGYSNDADSLEEAVKCVKTCLIKEAERSKSSANSILNYL